MNSEKKFHYTKFFEPLVPEWPTQTFVAFIIFLVFIVKIILVDLNAAVIPTGSNNLNFDPLFRYQWGLANQGQKLTEEIDDLTSNVLIGESGQDIMSLAVYELLLKTPLHKRPVVAIIDSGLDTNHPELKNALYKNLKECDENGQLRFRATDDRDGNGFIGDCMGWDFTTNTAKVSDENGHGTHLAGIMAAAHNGSGISGMGKEFLVLPLKVIHGQQAMNAGDQFTERVLKAINYAIRMKVDVINLSLGWPRKLDSEALRMAIRQATEQNIIVVAAAGNNNSEGPIYPCAYNNVICVGAITNQGNMTGFSNFGGGVDLMAPGQQILSTLPTNLVPTLFSIKGFDLKNGTSQAAPFVSGLALYLKGLYPEASISELRARLFSQTILGRKGNQEGDDAGNSYVGQSLLGPIRLLSPVSENCQIPTPCELFSRQNLLIVPQFKGDEEIDLDVLLLANREEGLSFKKEIVLENLNKVPAEIEVEVFAENGGVENNLKISGYTKKDIVQVGENISITMEGKLSTLMTDSEFKVSLVVKSKTEAGEKKEWKFSRRFILAQKSPLVAEKSVVLPNLLGVQYLLKNKLGMASGLRTIQQYNRDGQLPDYFIIKNLPPKPNEMPTSELHLLRSKMGSDGNISFGPKKINFQGKFVSFHRHDFDFDKKAEYLLVTLEQSGSGAEDRYLNFKFMNEDLSPKEPLARFGQGLKYVPSEAAFDPAKAFFVPITLPGGGPWQAMAFVGVGQVTENDQVSDPFGERERRDERHLYYLIPDFIQKKMITRTFDGEAWRDKISQQLNLSWQESLLFVGPLAQGASGTRNGELSLLFEYGIGANSKKIRIDVSQNFKYSVQSLSQDSTLVLSPQLAIPIHNIDGEVRYNGATGMVIMQNDTVGSAKIYDRQGQVITQFSINHRDKRDHVLGLLAGNISRNFATLIYQTKGQLVTLTKDLIQGTQSVKARAIDRVSFLPGNVFNELFYPVSALSAGQNNEGVSNQTYVAGLYVDATQINSGRIYVLGHEMREGKGQLSSLLANSYKLDKECLALNPVELEGPTHFVSLCSKNNTVILNFIPMLAP